MADDRAWADRSWDALSRRFLRHRHDGRVLVRQHWVRADAWTVSQIVAAAVARAGIRADTWSDVDGLYRGLDDHLFRDIGYTGAHSRGLGPQELYYDDNAWIGLASVGSALLRARFGQVHFAEVERDLWRARMIVRLLRFGEHPDGGVLWRVGGDTRNACSTGPAGILAVRVVESERRLGIEAPDHSELLAFALRCAHFLDRLVDDAGMVADHLRADGSIDPPVYAYNQGTAIGLHVQLARMARARDTGSGAPVTDAADRLPTARPRANQATSWQILPEQAHLSAARRLAEAAETAYAPGGVDTALWRDCPVFVAILCRNLLTLWAEDGDERWPQLVDTWRAAMETSALDPRTGDYTRNGVGHYDKARALDRAGVCSVHWARRWPADLVHLLT